MVSYQFQTPSVGVGLLISLLHVEFELMPTKIINLITVRLHNDLFEIDLILLIRSYN